MSGRTATNPARRHETGAGSETPWIVLGVVVLTVAVVVASLVVAARVGGAETSEPAAYLVGLWTGASRWPGWRATVVLSLILMAFAAAGGGAWWLLRSRRSDPRRVGRIDAKAHSMARTADLSVLLPEGAAADAERLKSTAAGSGVPLAQHVPSFRPISGSYEWVQSWILGPRAGKTTCVVVRQICETNGPVVATSNKRDVVDLTRLRRLELGHCWVYDPQDLIGEPSSWWWNPLTFVTSVDRADELAGLFASASTEDGARPDAYFEPEGTNYLSSLLLAAATSRSPITAVYEWMSDTTDPTPVEVLQVSGFGTAAAALQGVARMPDEQRAGVVGTARKMVDWLRNPAILRWITADGPDDARPQFDPDDFIRTRQTLYLISREGAGSARAVTAALAVATMRAGERLAGRSAGGRLPLPLHVILDEAANVVRWKELPDMYSHFGSRGILLSTFFQSWSQGCRAYTEAGMKTLWSASNIRVVGAGVAEPDFLENWSRLIGDHDVITKDRSVAPASRDSGILGSRVSISSRLRRERIFEASELAALPSGRAVMLASGTPAALIRLVHWSETPYASTIAESMSHFGDSQAASAEASIAEPVAR